MRFMVMRFMVMKIGYSGAVAIVSSLKLIVNVGVLYNPILKLTDVCSKGRN